MLLLSQVCLLRIRRLFKNKTQSPQSGIGAGQHEEDQDQHFTSSLGRLVLAELPLFCETSRHATRRSTSITLQNAESGLILVVV